MKTETRAETETETGIGNLSRKAQVQSYIRNSDLSLGQLCLSCLMRNGTYALLLPLIEVGSMKLVKGGNIMSGVEQLAVWTRKSFERARKMSSTGNENWKWVALGVW